MGTSVSGAAGTGAADETEGVRVSSSISSGGGGGIRRCSALFGSESGSRFDGCGGLAAQSLRRSFFGPVTSPAASHATLCAAAAAAWNEDYDHNYDKAWCLRALGGAAWAGTDNADGPLANAFEAQGPVVWVPDNVQEAHMVSYQEHDGPGFVSRRCDPAVLNLAAFVIPGVEGGVEDVRYVFASGCLPWSFSFEMFVCVVVDRVLLPVSPAYGAVVDRLLTQCGPVLDREHSPMHELQSQSW